MDSALARKADLPLEDGLAAPRRVPSVADKPNKARTIPAEKTIRPNKLRTLKKAD
jgi:hypothetical protein